MAEQLPFGAIKKLDENNYVFEVNRHGKTQYVNAPTLDAAFDIVDSPDYQRQQDEQQNQIAQQRKMEARAKANPFQSALMGLYDGLTFGFGKYPIAGIKAASHFLTGDDAGEAYKEGLEGYKKANELASTAYPSIYGISSGTGMVAPMLTGGGLLGAATKMALKGIPIASRAIGLGSRLINGRGLAGVAGRAVAAAPAGAAVGALDAAGHDNDVTSGALTGAAVGAAGAPVLDLARPIVRALSKTSNRAVALGNGVTSKALKRFEKIRDKANLTNEDIINGLQDAQNNGADLFTVADILGNQGARGLSGLARQNNEAATKINDYLTGRQLEQPLRLSQAFTNAVGENVSAAQKKIAIRAAQKELGDMEYGQVRNEAPQINLNEVRGYLDQRLSELNDPIGVQVEPYISLNKIRNVLSADSGAGAPFASVHNLKQNIDDMAQSAMQRGDRNLGGQLAEVSRQLNQAIEQQSPTYSKAAQNWANFQKAQEAVDAGRSATNKRAADIIDEFSALNTPEQQQGYKVGFASRPLEQIENSRPGTDSSRRFLTPTNQQVFPAVYGEDAGSKLLRQLQLEKIQNETYNRALSGSRTADNLSDMDSINGVREAIHTGLNIPRLFAKLTDYATDKVTRLSDEDKMALASLLLQKPNNTTTKFFQNLINRDHIDQKNMKLLINYLNPTARGETVKATNE